MPSKYLLCLATSLLFLSLFPPSFVYSQKANEDAVPAEFKCTGCVLLIIEKDRKTPPFGFNKYVEKTFKKDYSGEFEIVTWKDIDTNTKYQDKSVYRFVLADRIDNSKTPGMVATPNSVNGKDFQQQSTFSFSIQYKLYDRKEDKAYPSMGVYSNSAKAIKGAAELLDEKLKH
ncbi:MAG TPA: hypothetical protein VMZ03_10955 [Chitinophagaceae bacterium]|nr:hypothetical protein [Chitinophagaceae bacterium]